MQCADSSGLVLIALCSAPLSLLLWLLLSEVRRTEGQQRSGGGRRGVGVDSTAQHFIVMPENWSIVEVAMETAGHVFSKDSFTNI